MHALLFIPQIDFDSINLASFNQFVTAKTIPQKRLQLTLFVPTTDSIAIESVRKKFNSKQYRLIKSHVTLCREDELEQIESVLKNLSSINFNSIAIHFGTVKRFSEGKGVLIPGNGHNEQFQRLRKVILKEVINSRVHHPHITLMHPRNSTCTDMIFEEIQKVNLPDKIIFQKICLIEQQNGNEWKVLREFDLK